ncbi:protein phosphatase 1 regulatory subunit 11 [Klebsormidium nitens]|uniref:Protein phosphatase 1 regulatory subunit 11 n=1 Tax=Klebsormidium nitens TaxID=105231 RepID=A0A1Y1IFT0_KLENI|nr:protein phosphatase 1 regulatory subunit 11 [Klebsormidium nitens]|eukprot:GAQ88349.1 protein phosphatase 1 regulatory subunit 11 [Klebsormidium nitens]
MEGANASAQPAVVTQTVTAEPSGAAGHHQEERVTLRLAPRRKKKVSWKGDTIDNEHLNKKSSKKCCIFQKQKAFDESSSDDNSDHECEHHQHKPPDRDKEPVRESEATS